MKQTSNSRIIHLTRCMISLAILSLNSSYGYLNKGYRHIYQNSGGLLAFDESKDSIKDSMDQEQPAEFLPPINMVAKRKDTCRLIISGVIGTEPKETYLSNGHYVINFALAVVGHYDSIHDWEKIKSQETMWINVEVWDEAAKDNQKLYRKGYALNGLGTLIFNKWIDKASGEERKMFKYRLLKLMTPEEMKPFADLDTLTFSSSNDGLVSTDGTVFTKSIQNLKPEEIVKEIVKAGSVAPVVIAVAVESVPVAVPATSSSAPAQIVTSEKVTAEKVTPQTPPLDVWRKYEPTKQPAPVPPVQQEAKKWEKKESPPSPPTPTNDAPKKWVPSKPATPAVSSASPVKPVVLPSQPQDIRSPSKIVYGSYDPDADIPF